MIKVIYRSYDLRGVKTVKPHKVFYDVCVDKKGCIFHRYLPHQDIAGTILYYNPHHGVMSNV